MLKVVEESEDNPFVDLIEFRSELTISEFVDLCAELRINTIDIPFAETIYRVGISGGWLRISLEGLKAISGSRPGDMNPLNTNVKSESSAIKKLAATFAISAMIKGTIGADTSGEISCSNTKASNHEASFTHIGLRALPNNKWRIENPRGQDVPIQSSVLTGEKLLSLRKIEAANRFLIEISVEVAPSEITVTSKHRRRRIRQTNRERVIQLIALRSLNERLNGAIEKGELLKISKSRFTLDGADD